MKQFIILISLVIATNVVAQHMPVMPTPKAPASKAKVVKSKLVAKPRTVYVEKQPQKATVKFISDVEATLYVDGESQGEFETDVPIKLKLSLGEHSIKVVSKSNKDYVKKWKYVVENTSKEYLETISSSDLVDINSTKGNTTPEKRATVDASAGTKKTTVKTVIDAYIKAIGGVDAINAVKSLVYISSVKYQQSTPLQCTIKIDSKGRMATNMTMEGVGLIYKEVINSDSGYTISSGTKEVLTGKKLANRKKDAVPFEETLLATRGGSTFLGIEPINGIKAYAIINGDRTYYFDVNTGLMIAQIEVLNVDGTKTTQLFNYKDYRVVEGIKFPFTITQTSQDVDLVISITNIKLNEGIYESDFY